MPGRPRPGADAAYHADDVTTLAGRMMLQRSPLFRGLAAATFERIAALASQRGYRRGEIVFSQGDPGDALIPYALPVTVNVHAGPCRVSRGVRRPRARLRGTCDIGFA